MGRSYHRCGRELGTRETLAWLGKWYGDTEDLLVKPFWMPCPDLRSLTVGERQGLSDLRTDNQSQLHAFLKLAALQWLRRNSEHPDTISSEVIYYFLDEDGCSGVRILDEHGREYDIRSPQILYDNLENFPLSYGHSMRADLHAFDITVEVGATEPFSLLMPLLERIADRAVWVPFPSRHDPSRFDLRRDRCSEAKAYSIRLRE